MDIIRNITNLSKIKLRIMQNATHTFSLRLLSSDSYTLIFSSIVDTLASDSCFAVSAVSSFEFISIILTSLSSNLAFSDKLSDEGKQKSSLYQGSSWALTVGRSDFSLQENLGEVTVR